MNYICSLTTIPSKIDNIYLTLDSIVNQTTIPELIVLNIPRRYNFRFSGKEIPEEKISFLQKRYSNFNFTVNMVDFDYGPGTKLIGLLDLDLQISNKFILLVDDDLIYKPRMIEKFDQIQKSDLVDIGSYYVYTIENTSIRIAQAADGLFIRGSLLEKFSEYYNIVSRSDFVGYHDDLYISFFFHLLDKQITFIEPENDQELIYDFHDNSMVDALSELTGKYSREKLNCIVLNTLMDLKNNGSFNFI